MFACCRISSRRSIYSSVNFIAGTFPTDNFMVAPEPLTLALAAINATAMNVRVEAFLCPTDSGSFAATGNNYRGNVGLGPFNAPWAESRDSGNGLFMESRMTRSSQITDGLSHTVAFSERLRGSGSGGAVPERDFWELSIGVDTADQLLVGCRVVARPGTSTYLLAGNRWFWSGRDRTLYSHTQTPNGRVPDCIQSHAITPPGMATARSWHFGGVNALMGDGSTRFVQETIDLSVWRGLGTRNGGELVD